MEITRIQDQQPQRDHRDMFSGEVNIAALIRQSQHLAANLVRFSAGGRTKWHTHTFAQTLVVVEGKGIIATEDREHVVEPGHIAHIQPGEKHWHGATDRSAMAHIAINLPGESIVLEPVEQIRTPGV